MLGAKQYSAYAKSLNVDGGKEWIYTPTCIHCAKKKTEMKTSVCVPTPAQININTTCCWLQAA